MSIYTSLKIGLIQGHIKTILRMMIIALFCISFQVLNTQQAFAQDGRDPIEPTVPAAPTNGQFVTLTSNPDALVTSWTPSADDGGSKITSQRIEVYADNTCTASVGGGTFTAFAENSGDISVFLASVRAANATDISFEITAINAVGTSQPSTCKTAPFDGKSPLVASITRSRPTSSPTAADSLTWKISFDSAVNNVNADDFSVSGTTATITNVVPAVLGSTTTYVITARGGDLAGLEGTVTLSFAAGQDIVDNNNNPLTDTASKGSNDNTYLVSNDSTAPTVVSITRQSPVTEKTNADSLTWQVTFDENVVNVSPGSFSVSGISGVGLPSVSTVSPSVYNVTASGGDLANLSGTVTLSFNGGQNVTDINGNVLTHTAPTGTNDDSFMVSNQGPVIASLTRETPTSQITNADSLTWSLLFSEISDEFNLLPENFTLSDTTATLSVTRFSLGFTITASGGDLASLNGTVVLSLNLGTYVDEFGNELASTEPTGANENFYILDNTAPSIAAIERLNPATSPTAADTVSWKIIFAGSGLQNADSSDFSVTGTTASLVLTNITTKGDFGDVAEATLSGGNLADLNGTVTLSLAAGQNITDQAGNPLASTAPTGTNNNTFVMQNSVEQTITFAQPADITYGSFSTLSATTTSGLPVVFSTPSAGICEIRDTDILARGLGACVVNANQAGNEDVLVAPQVSRTINIVKRPITVVPSARSKDFGTVLVLGTTLFTVKENGIEVTLPFGETVDGVTMQSAPGIFVNGTFDPTADPASEPFATARTYNGNITITAVTGGNGFDANNYDVTFGSANLTVIDATPPTLISINLDTPASSPTNADSLKWMLVFSENITGIDASDFIVTGTTGTVTYVGAAAGASTFGVMVSGGDLANVNGNVTIALKGASAEIFDEAFNPLTDPTPTGANNNSYTVDNTSPSVTITMAPSATNGAFDVDFEFSEDVTGFVIGDITFANGTASNFSGSGKTYKATITPNGNGDITVAVNAGVATDAATNENTAAIDVTVTVDQTAPDVTISNVPTLTNAPFTATFTFTEDVSGFALADINAGNGAVSNLVGGASVFTALITPTNDGDVTIDVAAGVAADGVGNGNTAASQAKAIFDGTPPSVVIGMAPSITKGAFDADFEFSEDVTGFVIGDITVTNGTASGFSGNGDAYKTTITPDGNGDITVAINAGVATDKATNENTAAIDVTVTLDDIAPLIAAITRQAPTTETTAADSLTWRVSFSEDVKNVGANDFAIAGTTASISVAQQSESLYDVTITGGDLDDLNGVVTLSLANAQDISDIIGNALVDPVPSGGNDNTFKVQNDVTPPTLTITGVPGSVDGPFTATFTFSEEVVEFTQDDIVVTNGDVSNFQNTSGSSSAKASSQQKTKNASGTVFTALITPAGEGDLTITVSERTLTDIAGNFNASEVTKTTIIDATPPNVVIDALPNDVRGPFVTTVRFNEDVSGFALDDLTLTNAAGSNFTSVNARQYSALITPIDQGTVTINVQANVAVDPAGNGNLAAIPVSTTFIDENIVRARTLRIINNFVARRADQITLNDPNLALRLLEDDTKGRLTGNAERHNTRLAFNGAVSGTDANLASVMGADTAARMNLWTEASFVSIHGETAENDLTLVYAGADYRVNDDTLIGLMGQFDWADEKDDTQNFAISGKGWMAGPYVVTRLTDKLVFDGRAAWGRSNNDISPSRTYTDEFKTSRWLLKGQLTGEFEVNDWRINPNMAVIYFEEDQKAYTDSLGINIPGQTVNLGRVTFGPRFSKTFEQSEKMSLTPSLNLRGIWDFEQAKIFNLDTGLANGASEFRARTEARITANFANGARLSLDGFYDGIGATGFEAYGIKFGIGFPIQ